MYTEIQLRQTSSPKSGYRFCQILESFRNCKTTHWASKTGLKPGADVWILGLVLVEEWESNRQEQATQRLG